MVMKPFCVANLKMSDLRSIEESRGGAPEDSRLLFEEATKQCRVLFCGYRKISLGVCYQSPTMFLS